MGLMKTGFLDGKNEISEYLNGASDYKLKKWVKAGLPVRIEEGRWMAHKSNLEEWLKWYTRQRTNANDIERI